MKQAIDVHVDMATDKSNPALFPLRRKNALKRFYGMSGASRSFPQRAVYGLGIDPFIVWPLVNKVVDQTTLGAIVVGNSRTR